MDGKGRVRVALLAALAVTGAAAARDDARKTYANPLDIDYRYNFEQESLGISYRTGADPVIVRHGDAYYLFQTLADGYWRSTDLVDWRFITPDRWPFDSMVAPAVISDGDRMLVMRSLFSPGAVLVSRDPARGRFDFLTRMLPELPNAVAPGRDVGLPGWRNGDPQPAKIPPGPWDPAFFRDDDGRWYLYWGSSDTFPLYGIELDMSKGMRYVGKPRALLALDPEAHGWERFGQDHRGAFFPDGEPVGNYMEGAWMTKVRGRYYLQYGAPGTEYNAYATGTYVGDSPLGPFTYAAYNPVGYKPGGFVQGRATGPRSRMRMATGGIRARRGSATTGPSSGASRCSRRPSVPMARCRSARASAISPLLAGGTECGSDRPVHRLDAAVLAQAGDGVDYAEDIPPAMRPTRIRARSG